MDDAVSLFYPMLEAATRDHFPTVTVKRNFPPWCDRDVRSSLRAKETAFNRTKRNRNSDTELEFKEKRKQF